VWQDLALREAADHKRRFPNYKYQPRQGAAKKRKPKVEMTAGEDEQEQKDQLHEDVRQLLLEGLKGEDLAQAITELQRGRSVAGTPSTRSLSTAPTPTPSLPPVSEGSSSPFMYGMQGVQLAPAPTYIRRPSSVPLPGIYSFPSGLPPLPFPRMPSFDFGGPHMAPLQLPRRPSSAQAAMFRTWGAPFDMPQPFDMSPFDMPQPFNMAPPSHRPFSPVSEGGALAQTNIFEEAYTDGTAFPGGLSWTFDAPPLTPCGNHFMPPQEIEISPLDVMPSHAPAPPPSQAPAPEWLDQGLAMPEATYADFSSPDEMVVTPSDPSVPLFAPRPQRAFEEQGGVCAWGADKHAPVGEHAHGDPFAAYINFGAMNTGEGYAPGAPTSDAYAPAPNAYLPGGVYDTNAGAFPGPLFDTPHSMFG
jgi:hypothetical protein